MCVGPIRDRSSLLFTLIIHYRDYVLRKVLYITQTMFLSSNFIIQSFCAHFTVGGVDEVLTSYITFVNAE